MSAEDQKALAQKLLADLGVGTTEKMGKAQQLKIGKHKLAILDGGFLTNQKTKQSRNPEQRLVVDFVVVESNAYEPGQKVQVAFFVQRAEYPEYEVSRFQDMLEAIQAGTGDTRIQSEVGATVMSPEGRGLQVGCEVSQGRARKKGDGFYTDEIWTPVQQTDEDIAALAEELEQAHGPWKAPGTVADAAKADAPAAGAKKSFLKR